MTTLASAEPGRRSVIGRFLSWWGGELAALLPAALAGRATAPRRLAIVLWDDAAPSIVLRRGPKVVRRMPLDLAAGRIRLPGAVVLRLPPSRGLIRQATLPRAAEADLLRVLRFEIDRLTPWTADRVRFTPRVLGPVDGGRQVAVEIAVAPRDAIEAARRALEPTGLVPTIVDVAGPDPEAPPVVNLLDEGAAARRQRRAHAILLAAVVALGLPLLAAAAALGWALIEEEGEIRALRTRVVEARAATEAVRQLQEEVAALSEAERFIDAHRRATPSAAIVLEAVSRALPDDVWLTELTLERDEVRLIGFAADASALIALLEESPHFSAVRYAAPSVRDRERGQDRFSVAAKVDPLLGPEP